MFQSGCNILQAVLAVIKALLHRGKVKLATPEGDLRSHQAVSSGYPHHNTTHPLYVDVLIILTLTMFDYSKTSGCYLCGLNTETLLNKEVLI